MNIDAAKRAGDLAKSIQDRQEMLARVQVCIDEGWRIHEVRGRHMTNGQERKLILDTLDAETSALSLNFIKQIYEGQIALLQADLDTAETWAPPAPEPAP